ncbi:MAG TPA: MraY family glycosyltransferase [Planctomycetota bacterium]|nr:MraY family glycosyltransferase [Planctomycetota bacterium]
MGIGLLTAFALAFALSALLGAAARPLARRIGFLDIPDLERKQGRAAIPYGGGPAMFLAFALTVAGLWFAGRSVAGAQGPVAELLPSFDFGAPGALRHFGAIGLGALLVFLMGLLDEARRIPPLAKFLVQIGAALILVWGGVRVTANIPGYPVSVALTVLWVVGITNAFNLLDNMDGLSAGTAAIAAFIFAMVGDFTAQPELAAVLAALSGAAAGFIVHNFCPARLYMGDSGAYWLGFTLSALTVEATFYRGDGPAGVASPAMLALGVPLLILAVPVFDTASVLWIRLRERRPLWVGDRSHLSHRLQGLGLSVREAVLAIWLLTLACGLGALYLKHLPVHLGVLVLAQAAAILAVVAILEGLGRRRE